MSASTVNHGLTPNWPTTSRQGLRTRKRRNVVENDDYARFVRRIITSYGIRIASGDIEGLTTLAKLANDCDDAVEHAINGLRNSGYSWTEIGERLGITRQAAHQRWSGDQS